MAHSLGSVLMWDVLCNQPHLHAGLSDMPPSLQPVPLAPRPSPPALQRQSASSQVSQHAVPRSEQALYKADVRPAVSNSE